MSRPIPPCKECDSRYEGCHASCNGYKEYRTEKSTKNGEPRSEKKIRDATKWITITGITRNGVVSVISCLVWFGIGAICGAMMLVAYSVITFDERKKKQEKEREKDDSRGVAKQDK